MGAVAIIELVTVLMPLFLRLVDLAEKELERVPDGTMVTPAGSSFQPFPDDVSSATTGVQSVPLKVAFQAGKQNLVVGLMAARTTEVG